MTDDFEEILTDVLNYGGDGCSFALRRSSNNGWMASCTNPAWAGPGHTASTALSRDSAKAALTELREKMRSLKPLSLLWRAVGCTRHCDGGHRGMDNCNACGCSGSMLLHVASRTHYPNTKDGWKKMRIEHPEVPE